MHTKPKPRQQQKQRHSLSIHTKPKPRQQKTIKLLKYAHQTETKTTTKQKIAEAVTQNRSQGSDKNKTVAEAFTQTEAETAQKQKTRKAFTQNRSQDSKHNNN